MNGGAQVQWLLTLEDGSQLPHCRDSEIHPSCFLKDDTRSWLLHRERSVAKGALEAGRQLLPDIAGGRLSRTSVSNILHQQRRAWAQCSLTSGLQLN